MPCSLVYKSENDKLFQKNLALAKAFGITNIWVLGENNDNRSLNSAAGRAHIPMIATELGGGGGVNPKMTNMAELGIFNILNHLKTILSWNWAIIFKTTREKNLILDEEVEQRSQWLIYC